MRLNSFEKAKFFSLIIFLLTNLPTSASECLEFPLLYNEANLPYFKVRVGKQELPFILDLGLREPLSIEKNVIQQLIKGKIDYHEKKNIDLLGRVTKTKAGKASSVNINGFQFNNVFFSIYEPWGVAISSNTSATGQGQLIKNTVGRSLFLSNKGVLIYSRKNAKLSWCKSASSIDKSKYPNTIWMPLKEDEEGIHLSVNYNKQNSLDFILDSACTLSLVRPQSWISATPCNIDFGEHHCQKMQGELNIGATAIETPLYLFPISSELKANGLLGDSFFLHADIIIDTVGKQLGIKSETPLTKNAKYDTDKQ